MTAIPNLAETVTIRRTTRSSARLRLIEPAPRTVEFSARELHPAHEMAKRLVNIAAALIGLVVAAPILLIVAIAVKLTSPGPVIYTQIRVGQDRRRKTVRLGHPRRANDLGGRPF